MMDSQRTYWRRQNGGEPLFPDLLWSRPEHRAAAGKLLIIGGNAFGFSAPAEAYTIANNTGAGEVRVLLPDKLRPTVGRMLVADYAPSTVSGSFAQRALDQLQTDSQWADGVLLAGDIGHNSETAILLEKFAAGHHGQLTVTQDAADYFTASPQAILARPETTLVLSFAQLQKLALHAKFPHPFTFGMDLIRLVETLHDFTETYPGNIVVKHLENILVASGGQVSSTKLATDMEFWRVQTATRVAVWWLQNSSKPFEALTTAVSES